MTQYSVLHVGLLAETTMAKASCIVTSAWDPYLRSETRWREDGAAILQMDGNRRLGVGAESLFGQCPPEIRNMILGTARKIMHVDDPNLERLRTENGAYMIAPHNIGATYTLSPQGKNWHGRVIVSDAGLINPFTARTYRAIHLVFVSPDHVQQIKKIIINSPVSTAKSVERGLCLLNPPEDMNFKLALSSTFSERNKGLKALGLGAVIDLIHAAHSVFMDPPMNAPVIHVGIANSGVKKPVENKPRRRF